MVQLVVDILRATTGADREADAAARLARGGAGGPVSSKARSKGPRKRFWRSLESASESTLSPSSAPSRR